MNSANKTVAVVELNLKVQNHPFNSRTTSLKTLCMPPSPSHHHVCVSTEPNVKDGVIQMKESSITRREPNRQVCCINDKLGGKKTLYVFSLIIVVL